ncbi:MFS transporter [Actinomycetes bacterium]|nr:MFS transporter [Actinomycetes bacterium]
MLQATVLGKQVYDITGRELDIGLLGLAEFLPAALLVLVTGSVADRFNRKIISSIAIAGELLCSVLLGLYALSDPTAVWPLFVIAVLFGTFRAFAAPSVRSLPPMVAPDGALPRTIALYSATWTSAAIIGPASGGLIYASSPALAYFVSAVLIGAGVAFLLAVKIARPFLQDQPKDPAEKVSLHTALAGLRFIRKTPILLAAISLDLFAVLFGGAVALLPAIAEDRLHVGDVAYGWLRAAPGIGAAIMAMLLASRPVTRRVGRTLLFVVGLFGIATVVLGVTTSYFVAFVALVILAGADMISVYIRGTLVPLVTPDDKRGRVMAVENVFIGASNELGSFESGVAAQAFGTQTAVIGGGIATLGVVAMYSIFFPTLRNVDRFEDLEGHGDEIRQ